MNNIIPVAYLDEDRGTNEEVLLYDCTFKEKFGRIPMNVIFYLVNINFKTGLIQVFSEDQNVLFTQAFSLMPHLANEEEE